MEIEAPTPDGPSNPRSKSRFEAASERRKAYSFVQLAVLRCHRAFTTKEFRAVGCASIALASGGAFAYTSNSVQRDFMPVAGQREG